MPSIPRPCVPSTPRPCVPSTPRPCVPSTPRPCVPSTPHPCVPCAPRSCVSSGPTPRIRFLAPHPGGTRLGPGGDGSWAAHHGVHGGKLARAGNGGPSSVRIRAGLLNGACVEIPIKVAGNCRCFPSLTGSFRLCSFSRIPSVRCHLPLIPSMWCPRGALVVPHMAWNRTHACRTWHRVANIRRGVKPYQAHRTLLL